jgi:hypothetical protein
MKRAGFSLLTALLLCAPVIALEPGAEAPQEMQGHVKVGDQAPSFALKDQNGQEHSLKDLLDADGFLALVFYRSADW